EYYKNKERELQVIRDIFKGNRDVEKAALAMAFENDKLKKEVESFMIQKLQGIKEDMLRSAQSIGDVTFMYRTVELDPIFVKNLMFELGKDKANQFIVVGNKENNYKVSISVYISKELAQAKGWHAGKIVKQLAVCIGGNGGGQEFYATAGGKTADGLQEAYIMAEKILTGEIQ
ncbi:MAG: alanine--tRNA ligase, partial [Flavobacteriales bacterium]|nr:alanine--tRNA ligase [Flavobacteriales bacterium]